MQGFETVDTEREFGVGRGTSGRFADRSHAAFRQRGNTGIFSEQVRRSALGPDPDRRGDA